LALAYLGTSDFAATVLRRLVADGEAPELIVTPPDRAQGRGRRLQPPPVALAAAELGLPLHQTEDVNSVESVAALAAVDTDLAMVCAFGQLVGVELLERIEMLNVHPSLLPRWRGAAPIERAIMAGDERTGMAIIRLVETLDAGPVALCEELAIDPGEHFDSLAARLAELGGELAVRAIRGHRAGTLCFIEQDEERTTYAAKIDPGERRLDPARSATELSRVVRALNPHIGAYLDLAEGGRLAVVSARPIEEGVAAGKLQSDGHRLLLGCGAGTLLLEEVRPAGKRAMPAADYLRGHTVPRLAL